MQEYPLQQSASGTTRRATIARRDRVTIHVDAASGGSSNPSYTHLLAASVPAEVLQVSGGEQVRGKQVEATTTYVVSIDYLPGITLDQRCQITIISGVYNGTVIYTHRVHFETDRSRPKNMQLHCRSR